MKTKRWDSLYSSWPLRLNDLGITGKPMSSAFQGALDEDIPLRESGEIAKHVCMPDLTGCFERKTKDSLAVLVLASASQ